MRFGRYETLSPIASGGMATVHLGRALGEGGFERLVAIKVMHPDIAGDPQFVAMFLDEARLAARVRHPHVVATIDVQKGPTGLFLVMDYVEGPSLGAILRALAAQGAKLPLGVGLRIVIDALLGLHAAHEQAGPDGEPLNIVHRDVSPQNILVGVDGHGKITDFGVALAEARLASTKGGGLKGKIAYMSPQQVQSEPLDRRADVYAAGVVLWEVLAGTRLFQGDNEGAILFAVLGGTERSPRDVDPHLPAALDRACMRALKTDPADRFPTALAFAEALEEAALAAGVAIATPRALAAFVRDLGAHVPASAPRDEGAILEEPTVAIVAAEREATTQVATVVSAPPLRSARLGPRARVALSLAAGAAILAGAALAARGVAGPSRAAVPGDRAASTAPIEAPPVASVSVAAGPSAAPAAIPVPLPASAPTLAAAASVAPPAPKRPPPSSRRPPEGWRPSGL